MGIYFYIGLYPIRVYNCCGSVTFLTVTKITSHRALTFHHLFFQKTHYRNIVIKTFTKYGFDLYPQTKFRQL